MQTIHHITTMIILFLTGIILFSINVFNVQFIKGLIVFLLFLVSINIYGIATKSITVKGMILMVAVSLLIVGVSVFGLFAVEQKAIGYKTLYDFSIEGIAVSLLILFLSSFLFAISISIDGRQEKKIIKPPVKISEQTPGLPKLDSKEIFPEGWEEASAKDLTSGNYTH